MKEYNMHPDEPIVLTGKDAENFDKYRKSKPTQKELDRVIKADRFYRLMCEKSKSEQSKK